MIEADPTNPNIVFAAGQFDYGIGSGGIFRSDDGGQTWKNLGYDQHPDFHALAFNPANTAQVLIGNDGGVWYSNNRGGRQTAGSSAQRVDLAEPERHGRPDDRAVIDRRTSRSRSSRRSRPCRRSRHARFWGGTQDNGTLRKSGSTQHVVRRRERRRRPGARRPDVRRRAPLGPSCYVYGTYFGDLAVPVHGRRATSSPTRSSATGST